MVRTWIASKTVSSSCYTQAISECFVDRHYKTPGEEADATVER